MNVTNASSQLTIHLCDLPSDLHSSCLALPIIPPPYSNRTSDQEHQKERQKMPPAAAQKVLTYDVQERVLCFHGPMLYEAKVLEVKRSDDKKELPEYKVHYKGWKNT